MNSTDEEGEGEHRLYVKYGNKNVAGSVRCGGEIKIRLKEGEYCLHAR